MQGLIGQDVGGYRIISQIGRGGMATVFKAYQASLDRYVAVNVMPPYYAEQDDTFLKRFRQEAKAIASLRHPNILIVIDYGEEDETTYIVMEFVEAGTLTEIMGKPMAPDQILGLTDQVAGALHYAHEQGVVHRDIKPSNILLPKPDWPLLTDFGLAKIVGGSQLTQSGTVAGTPAYMSPEQGRGEKVDSRSDIYSLGIVLYEMATGVVPFRAETPMAVVVKHIIDPLPLPRDKNPELSEGIERVILKSLSKDPDDRFQDAEQMAKALKEAVSELPAGVAEAVPAVPTAQVTTMVDEADVSEEAVSKAEAAAAAPVENLANEDGAAKKDRPMLSRGGKIAVGFGGLLLAAIVCVIGLGALSGEDTPAGEQPAGTEQELSSVDIDPDLERIPENIELFLEQARVLAESGEYDSAGEMINAATEIGSEESWVHEEAGYLIMFMQDYGPAAEEFRQALRLDPLATWNYSNLAAALVADGREDEAIGALLSAFDNPAVTDDPLELSDLGWEFLSYSWLDEAEQAFFRSIEAGAAFPDPWVGLANQRYAAGDIPSAMAELQAGIDTFPDYAPFYESMGYWAWEEGDIDRAIEAFSQAIERDQTNSSVYGALASLLADQGSEVEAKILFRRGLDQNPNDPGFYVDAGNFHMQIGEIQNALPFFETALELDPDSGWYHAHLARATAETGGHDTARELLEEASAKNSGDPWLDEFIGWTFMMMNDCEQAVDHFERALAIDPSIESAEQGIRECRG